MSEILESLSDPTLIQAVEANIQTGTNQLGDIFAATFYHEPEATWFVIESAGFNRVASTSFTRETPESDVDRTLKQIAKSVGGGPMPAWKRVCVPMVGLKMKSCPQWSWTCIQ
jgi:hypothetical protein